MENCWSENGDTSDANPLLHDLKPDDELYTASSVKFAAADAEEHGDVALALSSLALKLGDVADVLEFCFGLAVIFAIFTTKAAKDVTGLLLTADLNKPSGRLGEKPDDCQQNEQQENLEGNRKSPGERSASAFVEVAATVELSVFSSMQIRNTLTYYSSQ